MNDENAEPNPILEAVQVPARTSSPGRASALTDGSFCLSLMQESLCSRGEIPVDLARQTEGTDLEAILNCIDLHDQLPTLIPSLLGARHPPHRAGRIGCRRPYTC
jgi:hypothetical protein